jgi:isopropylmalate/homocitrate/citramalate synthase
MMDKDKIWTGDLNDEAIDTGPFRKVGRVGLYDTTLRDGEQTVGVVLDPETKLELAVALDKVGMDRIEAGFPRVSADDVHAYELIMDAGLDAEIWGFSRAVPADLEQLFELGVKAAVIESPLSDGKLAAYGLSREKILSRIVDAVSHASSEGMTVCFFGVDGSRADFSFLEEAYRAAVEAGAQEIAVVDTLGIAAPEAAALLVSRCRDWLGSDIPIHWHGHNDFGLATACAIEAVRAGATWIHGTINGMGERAGNANLAEFALAIEALYGTETNLRFEHITEVADLVQKRSGYSLEPYKPVTGANLFRRESGAVASQFHDPQAVEPYSSELVSANREIVLGKKSGIDSIRIRVTELALDVPEDRFAELLSSVKELGASQHRLVTDDELRELAGQMSSVA